MIVENKKSVEDLKGLQEQAQAKTYDCGQTQTPKQKPPREVIEEEITWREDHLIRQLSELREWRSRIRFATDGELQILADCLHGNALINH